MAQQTPEPMMIRQIANGVVSAYAMQAGMQLDLFTALDTGPMRAENLADALGVQTRHLQLLLDTLLYTGLLVVMDGRYANGEEAGHFLVRGKPGYMGATFDLWSAFWHAVPQTAATIRIGAPQAEHDYSHMSEEDLLAWMRPINGTALEFGKILMERYDFSAYRSLLDVGGGLGGLSVMLAEAYPGLHATIVDLPTVTSLAERYLAEEGMADRVDICSIDLLHDTPVGQYDVAVLMRFVQCFRADDARTMLRNIGTALRPGGMIVIVGLILNDSRLTPTGAVLTNMVFLNLYDGGQAYTETEHRRWLVEAGFTDIRRDEALSNLSVITAWKV